MIDLVACLPQNPQREVRLEFQTLEGNKVSITLKRLSIWVIEEVKAEKKTTVHQSGRKVTQKKSANRFDILAVEEHEKCDEEEFDEDDPEVRIVFPSSLSTGSSSSSAKNDDEFYSKLDKFHEK